MESLPTEVLSRIIGYLYRQPKHPNGRAQQEWKDLHQQDLTVMMRLNVRFHDITARHLYSNPFVELLTSFFHGIDTPKHSTTHSSRMSKIAILRIVPRLVILDPFVSPASITRLLQGNLYDVPDCIDRLLSLANSIRKHTLTGKLLSNVTEICVSSTLTRDQCCSTDVGPKNNKSAANIMRDIALTSNVKTWRISGRFRVFYRNRRLQMCEPEPGSLVILDDWRYGIEDFETWRDKCRFVFIMRPPLLTAETHREIIDHRNPVREIDACDLRPFNTICHDADRVRRFLTESWKLEPMDGKPRLTVYMDVYRTRQQRWYGSQEGAMERTAISDLASTLDPRMVEIRWAGDFPEEADWTPNWMGWVKPDQGCSLALETESEAEAIAEAGKEAYFARRERRDRRRGVIPWEADSKVRLSEAGYEVDHEEPLTKSRFIKKATFHRQASINQNERVKAKARRVAEAKATALAIATAKAKRRARDYKAGNRKSKPKARTAGSGYDAEGENKAAARAKAGVRGPARRRYRKEGEMYDHETVR